MPNSTGLPLACTALQVYEEGEPGNEARFSPGLLGIWCPYTFVNAAYTFKPATSAYILGTMSHYDSFYMYIHVYKGSYSNEIIC